MIRPDFTLQTASNWSLGKVCSAASENRQMEGPMVRSSVGPYQVLEIIRTGGMSEVLLANDPRLKRRVALKRLLISNADEPSRIKHEAQAIARLHHSNIAAVYDVFEHEGRPLIVMEYAEGQSLRERLMRGRLPLADVLTIGRQLASAVAAAHAQEVIHRDLKPANVHVTDEGLVKVVDFGIALLLRRSRPSDQSSTSDVPIPNFQRVGTPAYMAPEQLTDGYADERSDIYSLGVVLFEMATGRRPFEPPEANEQVSVWRGRVPSA